MKKTILALMMVALSLVAFAEQGNGKAKGKGNKINTTKKVERMENRQDFFLKDLSAEQKLEFKKLHTIHRKEMQLLGLDIQAVNIEVKKIVINEKEESPELKKLLDKKAALKSEKELKMILFRKEIKTKFGIELPDFKKHNKGRMGNRKGMENKGQNHQFQGQGRKMNCQ